MKSITRHTGILTIVGRLPSSKNGNPRYDAIISESGGIVRFRTAVDSSYAYSLPNHNGERIEVLIGSHYGHATLDSLWARRDSNCMPREI